MNLTHQFLIATPSLQDPAFAQTVVYIARHDDEGAMGFIVNRLSSISLNDVLMDLQIRTDRPQGVVYHGGPVRPEVGFVLHSGQPTWSSSVAIAENLCLTTSKDILRAIALEDSVRQYSICLGHAGWSGPQLEAEIERGDWLMVRADPKILFDLPANQRYSAAQKLLGVDGSWLSDEIGHA